jgi:hypothetical protein
MASSYAKEASAQQLGVKDLRKLVAQKTYGRTEIANTQLAD